MIGNDIVDLACAAEESDWQRKGWLQKLFTVAEEQLIFAAQQPRLMIWLLWSMKEAAYKIWNRESGLSRLMPLRFICTDVRLEDNAAYGAVVFEDQVYPTQSRITVDFVHTLALEQNNFGGMAVYINDTAETMAVPGYALFRDAKGLPFLQDKLTGGIRVVSLSHHGRFKAMVFPE